MHRSLPPSRFFNSQGGYRTRRRNSAGPEIRWWAVLQGNIATSNDRMWEKYQLGAKHNVADPQTGQPATRNIFYPRKTTGGADLPPGDPRSLVNDSGMAALIERGVDFLT